MVGQVKVRFCIVFVLLAGIITVIGCSPSPSEEEIRQIVQSEVAKLKLPEGERGSQGEAGAQGERGERGPLGEAGAQGERGERGSQGEAGAQSERGEQGPEGEAGAQGERGPQGEVGPQGERGEQGPEGEAGPQGERGPQGEAAPPTSTEETEETDGWSTCTVTLTTGEAVEFECGYVPVPADYRDPEAGSINILINVHRATSPDERIGYLFVNPGGPGGSGVNFVALAEYGVFTDEILARFDIIGFDPRGVGASEPAFACGEVGEQLALRASVEDYDIDTPEEIAAGEAAANLCIESMGPVGGLLHSAYVARDMDEIRKALGADQISYLGFSYGSTLGAWYATLFPESVRAMVVDGATNPIEEGATIEERIAEAIEDSGPTEEILERALKGCASSECPIYNDGDPVGYYLEAATKLDLVNSAAGGYPLAGYLGVFSALYNEALWPQLWEGLFELNENADPAILLELAMRQSAVREQPGASFTEHVNCLDSWTLPPILDRSARLEESAIINAATEGMFPLTEAMYRPYLEICLFYDQFAPSPLEGPFDGGGVPILVVGNHADPATPFIKSEELATEVLSNAFLVETSHHKHVVYPGNECVNSHVHRALIDGVYPSERRVFCEREDPEP